MSFTIFPNASGPSQPSIFDSVPKNITGYSEYTALFGTPFMEYSAYYGVMRDEYVSATPNVDTVKRWLSFITTTPALIQNAGGLRPTYVMVPSPDGTSVPGVRFNSATTQRLTGSFGVSVSGTENQKPFTQAIVFSLDQDVTVNQTLWSWDNSAGWANRQLVITADGQRLQEFYNNDANLANNEASNIPNFSRVVIPTGKRCIAVYVFDGVQSTTYLFHDEIPPSGMPVVRSASSFNFTSAFNVNSLTLGASFQANTATPVRHANITVHHLVGWASVVNNVEQLVTTLARIWRISERVVGTSSKLGDGLQEVIPLTENLSDRRGVIAGTNALQFFNDTQTFASDAERLPATEGVFSRAVAFRRADQGFTGNRNLRWLASGIWNLSNRATWTVEFWVKPLLNNYGNNQSIFALESNATTTNRFFALQQTFNGTSLRLSAYDNTGALLFRTIGNMVLNQWNQIVFWRETDGLIYVSLNNSAPLGQTVGVQLRDLSAQFLTLGSLTGANSTNDDFHGDIAHVRLWDRVLPSAERTALWNSGSGMLEPFATTSLFDITNVPDAPPVFVPNTSYVLASTGAQMFRDTIFTQPGNRLSMRFIPERGGRAIAIRTNFRNYRVNENGTHPWNEATQRWEATPPASGTGYSRGTGGIARIELCQDSGGLPGTVLTSVDINILNAWLPWRNGDFLGEFWYKAWNFPTNPQLTAGTPYHIRLGNVDPAPSLNYFSVNGAWANNGAVQPPNVTDPTARYEGGLTSPRPVPQNFPIFMLHMDTGTNKVDWYEGMPYWGGGNRDADISASTITTNTRWQFFRIGFPNSTQEFRCRQVIVVPASTLDPFYINKMEVDNIYLNGLRFGSSSGTILCELKNAAGTVLDTATISTSNFTQVNAVVQPNSVSGQWSPLAPFAASTVQLMGGQTYYLEFSTTSPNLFLVRPQRHIPWFDSHPNLSYFSRSANVAQWLMRSFVSGSWQTTINWTSDAEFTGQYKLPISVGVTQRP